MMTVSDKHTSLSLFFKVFVAIASKAGNSGIAKQSSNFDTIFRDSEYQKYWMFSTFSSALINIQIKDSK